jgi:tetratricopeptide (TPR) repeat protein
MNKGFLTLCSVFIISGCSGAPLPEAVAIKTPQEIKEHRIEYLRDALQGQFKIVGNSKPLYLGELRGLLEDLIKLGENDIELRLNLAQVLVFEKRFERALEIFKDLVEQADHTAIIRSYGEALVAAGRLEEAESVFIEDHKKYPKRLDSLGHAASLAWNRGDSLKALDLASQVLLERPLDPNALAVIVRDALAKDKPGIVGLLFERARVGNVYSPELSWLAGQNEENKGELARALRVYREGAERFPEAKKLREAVGATALGLSDGRVAHEAYTWLLNREPKEVAWQLGLAVAARLQGRLDEAARFYDQILKQDPDVQDALWNDAILAHIYQGDYERAYQRLLHLKKLTGSDAARYEDLETQLAQLETLAEEERVLAAEEEMERLAQVAIQGVCDSLARSQTPDFSALSSGEVLSDAGWDLLAQAVTQWEEAPAQAMEQATCAFAVAEKAEGFREESCSGMHYSWAKKMDQAGDRVEAMRHLKAALECDPSHEEARVLMERVSAQ